MKLLLIPDKFDGSLTSESFANAFIDGMKKTGAPFTSRYIKATDGGEGFLRVIANYKPCISVEVISENPLREPIRSYYLYNKEDNSAYIELANASGLELLPYDNRNPMLTTTYGTGIEIKDAVEKGVKHIYIGLGASATNDGGIGIANALGYDFLNENGVMLPPVGSSLQLIRSIDDSRVIEKLKQVKFYTVNDVVNPLFGKNGAAYVYAKYKGASDDVVTELNKGLIRLNKVVSEKYNVRYNRVPGAGAAGGAAFGLKTFLNAEFLGAMDFILELSGLSEILHKEKFDYIITGEGKIDEQNLNSKLLQGVIGLGKEYGIPVIAICGVLEISKEKLKEIGVFDVFEIQDERKDFEYNMKHAAVLLTTKTAEYFAKK
ncbi:glycerate kinase [Maribacter caenipelagi]|uniref:Glycerate kinase n=1 Tax=Maribacter caenipelagi TaxID=1447781 RepID=A0A4R7CWK0_9FLAO|nr:glycerate kinase [Maribacter caenipelagi]TDS12620.1 glycerate kinase [Maribacter caenipelagi]